MKLYIGLFKSILFIILININYFNAMLSMQAAKLTTEENSKLNARYIKLHKNVKAFVTFSKFQVMSEDDRRDAEDRSDYAKSFLSHYMSFEDWNVLATNQKKKRVEEELNRQIDKGEFSIESIKNEINNICRNIKSVPNAFKSQKEYTDNFRLRWHMLPSEYVNKLREILAKKGIRTPPLKEESITNRVGR